MALAFALTVLWFILYWYQGYKILGTEGDSGSTPGTSVNGWVNCFLLGLVLPLAVLCCIPSLYPNTAPFLFGKSWILTGFAVGKPQ